jgi:hypothetical protein
LSDAPWEEWSQTVSEKDALATWDHIAHSPNYSIEKARSLLGYEPIYSSLAVVKESVEWLVAEGVVSTSQQGAAIGRLPVSALQTFHQR